MSMIADLRPGMIGFGPIHGGAGMLVNAGQLLLGEGFHVGKLDIRHVFVVVESSADIGTFKPAPRCAEAMPSGAREATIRDRWTPEYAYVQLPEDYPGQGEDAAAIARAMIGTPYSPLSYVALAAWRFDMLKGEQLPDGTIESSKLEKWIDRRHTAVVTGLTPGKSWTNDGSGATVMDLPREAICSVLADQAWALSGKQVMPAGTPHQCVTPGALAQALLETDGAKWLWPR